MERARPRKYERTTGAHTAQVEHGVWENVPFFALLLLPPSDEAIERCVNKANTDGMLFIAVWIIFAVRPHRRTNAIPPYQPSGP